MKASIWITLVNLFFSFEFGDEDPVFDMQAMTAHYADSAFGSRPSRVRQAKPPGNFTFLGLGQK